VNFIKVFWGFSEMVSQISSFEFKQHAEANLISLYLTHVKLDYLGINSDKNTPKLITSFHQHAHNSKT
jgi:hypothetical protein